MPARPALVFLALATIIFPSASLAHWRPDGAPVCTAAGYQDEPQMVPDGSGGAIVAWIDFENFAIYCQRIDADGNALWVSGGVPVCATPAAARKLIPDGAGGVIIVWEDWRNENDTDLYAQRINSQGVAQWMADGVVICSASNDQRIPQIVPDGSGGAIVTWFDYRLGTPDIYAQKVNASGVVQWAAGGVIVCAATGGQYSPAIVGDDAGGATIAWSDWRSASTVADIYAQRLSPAGAPQWAANGIAVCVAASQQDVASIVAEGGGGSIIAWEDHRPGADGIYVQRVNSSGSVQWTANGINLCSAPNAQTEPVMVADAGGAIVAWKDTRNGVSNADLFAQRIDTAGQAAWTANGVSLCAAPGNQFNHAIASDGGGGVVAVWMDHRSQQIDGFDIYSQQLSTVGWAKSGPNGTPLCSAGGDQWFPVIVNASVGHVIAAWSDFRGTDQDIYAQILDTNSTGTAAGRAPRPGLAILHNYPNPFSAGTEIEIQMPHDGAISIDVYDVAGRSVRSQRTGEQRAGRATLRFDGRNDAGHDLPSGVYFYRVTANGETAAHRMVILR